jgi:predicted PurR-regulated permease PerM
LRPILTLGGLVLVTAFLYWARPILIPIALATLFAFILAPAVSALQRRGPGRVASVLIVVALAFGVVGGIGYFLGQQLADLVRRLPEYQFVINSKVESLSGGSGGGLFGTLRNTVKDVNERIAEVNQAAANDQPEATRDEPRGSTPDKPLYVDQAGSVWSGLAGYIGPAAEGLASAILVLVLVVFMLVQRENLRNRLVCLLGHGQIILTTRAINEGADRISRFLVTQLCVNAGFGLAVTIILLALSFFAATPQDAATLRQYALLWGFICGLMRFVPYIGTWVGAAMLIAFSVATLHGWTLPLVIFAAFVVVELLCANAVEPLLIGHSTGSSPLALLVAAAFWAWLWGPVGLLLSTPLTVILVVAGKYVPQLDFLEVLLGDEPALGPDIVLYQRLVARDQDEAADLVDEFLTRHTPEETYQNLLLPAVVLARRDLDRSELDGEQAADLYRMVRELIDDIAPPAPAALDTAAGTVKALGCPARDEVDELALRMLAHTLRQHGRTVELVSSKALTAEVLERVAAECPAVVVVGSVAPGGAAQARYLCKRVKSQCDTVRVVVGRWGAAEDDSRVKERLKAAGADVVGDRLDDTRVEVASLLQVAAAARAPAEREPELAASK